MNIINLLSLTPKIALLALIVIGVLILYEFIQLFHKDKKASENAQKAEELKPIKFKDSFIKINPSVQKPVVKSNSQFPIVQLIIFILLIILIIGGIYFVYKNRDTLFVQQNITVPNSTGPATEEPKDLTPEIILYQILGIDSLKQINKLQLRSLQVNDTVRIAVKTNKSPQSVLIIVNGESFFPPAGNVTPEGYPYIDYRIKQGVLDYTITVEVQ